MKIVNIVHSLVVHFRENETNVLCIENRALFTSCVHNLWKQCEGNDGEWILSDVDNTLSITKKIECITNPFGINFNNKKIINNLYKEMIETIQEQYLKELISLNGQIVNFIDYAAMLEPYEINIGTELDLAGLFKLYDVKFEVDDISLIDRLISYIKIMHQVCRKEIFVFVNLKSYLEENELLQLYEAAFYEKVFLWLIESRYENKNKYEKVQLIDKDLCIIEL